MLKCDICDKVFENYRQLNGHKSSHKRGEEYAQKRASARVQPAHVCKHCEGPVTFGYTKSNEFCSSRCFADWSFIHRTIPRIERGECTHNSAAVLKRYLRETCGDACAVCGQQPTWNNKPLVLQLDHIDGDSDNNALTNIRLICPNCHTQTDTFGTKGQGSRYKKVSKRNAYIREYRGADVKQ